MCALLFQAFMATAASEGKCLGLLMEIHGWETVESRIYMKVRTQLKHSLIFFIMTLPKSVGLPVFFESNDALNQEIDRL